MIAVSDSFPFVEVEITIGLWSVVDWAYISTAADVGLIIPAGLAREIPGTPDRMLFRLVDGGLVRAPTWRGVVQIVDREFKVQIAAIGTRFLLGRQVIDHLTVCLECGQRVVVTRGE